MNFKSYGTVVIQSSVAREEILLMSKINHFLLIFVFHIQPKKAYILGHDVNPFVNSGKKKFHFSSDIMKTFITFPLSFSSRLT